AIANKIQLLIIESKTDVELEKEIKTAYDQMKEPSKSFFAINDEYPYVAVRPSATINDLPTPFPGHTCLNAHKPEKLLRYIKKTWATLFSAQAIYYREKYGLKHENAQVSVIVQKMIPGQASGLMQTAILTGDESKISIEAAFGLGNAVMTGDVATDNYLVDKENLKILERRVQEQVWKSKKSPHGLTTREDVPVTQRSQQKIQDYIIKKVAELGKT
ncbi:MAG: hypothetical protein GOV15_02120, partial [Candidatus Diapherotrites archaeon]|nr:hypothetical protein [Candidatus Diapherotrites archaeon]